MAKAKKARISKNTSGAGAGGAKKIQPTSNNPHSNNNPNKKQKGVSQQQQKQQKNQRPIVPFGKHDRILLVGEGEFYLHTYIHPMTETCTDKKQETFHLHGHW